MSENLFNLTNPQKSIWYTEEYLSGTNIGNICGTLVFKESVDFKKLEQSINILIQKHDNFRIKFVLDNNTPKQYIEDYSYIRLKPIELFTNKDLSDLEKKTVSNKFNLFDNFLYKFIIFKFSDNTGGFILNIHHLISDGWSFNILLNEIIKIYNSLINNENINIPSYSYINYIKKENDYLNSSQFKKDKQFWNSIINNIPEIAVIPNSKNTNNLFSYKSNRLDFDLPSDLLDSIKELCNKYNISLFNFFMSIYSIYINRVTNLNEFIIGTPILNRSNYEERNTCGMFTSTVPFKVSVDNNIKFSDFILDISKNSLQYLRHQKYPYHSLLTDIREKNNKFSKLYTILLSYQNSFYQKNIDSKKYKLHWTSNNCISDSLDIHIYDISNEKINISYDYKADFYDDVDIINIHNRIINIIYQIIHNSHIHLNDIKLLTSDEEKEILIDFNNNNLQYSNKNIIELFKDNVFKTPNNIALIYKNKTLTYSQLDVLSNKVAHYLNSIGLDKNSIISICMPKDMWFVICLLAVQKIGGVYLPISVNYPQDRINYMITDSNSDAIITDLKINTTNKKCKKISINNINLDQFSTDYTVPVISFQDLSYIIYTSGSTGTPKGIKVTHGNLLNFVHSFNNCFDKKFNSSDYCLSITDISFDVSICELIVPLVFGSKLVIYTENTLTDLNLLCETIYKNKITFLYLPPNILTDVYELLKNVHTDINKFLVGIAPIKNDILNKYLKLNSKMEIINGYGASEATICSTFYKFHESKNPNEIVPIGKPLNNNNIYILDNYKNIQPIGLKGEIYISGKNVSDGYINSNLNKGKFIDDPFFPGNKCYKTGDIAYWNPDGNITFVGRNDNQIKFRGYRIELEEITNILKQIDGISNAITTLKQINNTEYIVSYYEGDLDDKNYIKSYLKTKLPVYMIPSYIIKLNKIPFNINGKIDENNLPDINTSLATKLDPINNTEEILVDMWKKILNINDIGTNEDFFEIGGDSLSAIRLLSNIKNTFNIDISISDIFNNSTIKNLSTFINLHDKSNTLKIYRSAKKDYYNVSSAQRRMYYTTYMINPDNIVYNVTGCALFDLDLDPEKVKNIFNYLIKRHSSFRTCFKIVNDTLVQVIKDSVSININTRKIVSGDISEIVNNFSKPFDLSEAPILRVELVYIENKTLLLIDSHHIIIDGRSLNILISEFIDLYSNKLLGNLELEYKDYSEWEYNYINSDNIKSNEDYWINQFKNEPLSPINLPYDYRKTNKLTYKGNTITQKIDKELFNSLLNLSKKLEVSPFVLFISLLYILLYKYTQDKKIIIGTPIESRYCKEIENIIGMFVNTMPIKIELDSNKNFKDILLNVKQTIIKDLEYQPYPYDLLIRKLNISKSNSSNPIFDVAFTYKNNHDLYLNNKKITIIEAKPEISKFDLSVEIDAQNYEINFNYSTDLFKISTMKDMLANYVHILEVINENNNIILKDINMLPDDYQNTILNTFNDNKKTYPVDTNIISLFEKQVTNNKNNIALKYLNQEVTYNDLNKKANQFANYLLSLGIKKNSHIAVCMDKNISLIISILAINKIGCSFIPICSDFPSDKINNIITDSKTEYMIVNNNTYGIKCDNIIDFHNINLNNYSCENLNTNILPEDILYIIYTSGTTGTPKGITISNKNLINFLYSFNDQFDNKFNSDDNCLSLTNISFDVFICELFTPLIFGSTLVIYPNNKLNDITLLYEIIKKENITFLHIPASVLDDVYNYISSKNELIHMNKLLVGVESIKNSSLNNYYNINPDIEIINGYGPSETTICCTFFKHKKTRNKNLIVPIGKPVNNNDIYIINNDYNLQPIGVKGQICISGDNVSPGYIDDSLNAKSYFNNPFRENSICYKTGDYGYWDKNGNIHFIGRYDNQVKLKGFRIELNEISKAIQTLDEISYVITVVKVIDSIKYICSYIKTKKPVTKTYVREKLNNILPFYMIPAYIIFLEDIPMTSNEKVDIEKLPLPTDLDIVKNSNIIIPPKNKKESIILELYKKVLNKNDIGVNHNFFEFGGDSLSAMKLQIQALNENISISYSDIFTYPTVEELSEHSHYIDNENVDSTYLEEYNKYRPIISKNILPKNFNINYTPINNVLLTGVTGFLGAHILDSFLKQEIGTIYCIVRHKDNLSSEERLKQTLNFYFKDKYDKYIGNRIKVIDGDITNYELSLDEDLYSKLGKQVNTVIHCAALVKHLGEYKEFKETNIKGTQKIVDFCEKFNLRLIHISTTSVSGNVSADGIYLNSHFTEPTIFSERDFYIGQNLDNLYIKSKFKSEEIVLDAIMHGLDAYILRIGNLTNRYSSGIFQQNHFENAFVNRFNSILKIGYIPNSLLDINVEFTPVDFAADAILKIATHFNNNFSIFHVLNDNLISLKELYNIFQDLNIPLKLVDDETFLTIINKINNSKSDNKKYLSDIINNISNGKLIYDSSIKIDSNFTKRFLSSIGFNWPIIDKNYIKKYIQYFIDIGYFNITANS